MLKSRLAGLAALGFAALGCAPADDAVAIVDQPILNGQAATEAELFGTVALFMWTDESIGCTGTLVAEDVVITAAHCFYDIETGDQTTNVEDVSIVAGLLDANAATDEDLIDLTSVEVPQGYPGQEAEGDPDGLGRLDDIAVLTLSRPVSNLTPVPVLDMASFDANVQAGTPIIVTGYGTTVETGDNDTGVLYIADTPYVRRTDHELFAGGTGEPDTCPGDSGGPAYVELDGAIYLVGATSRGTSQGEQQCGNGGIYTMVAAYDDYVEEKAPNFPGAVPPKGSSGSGGNGSGSGNGDKAANGDDAEEDGGGCQFAGPTPDASHFGWLLALALGATLRRRSS